MRALLTTIAFSVCFVSTARAEIDPCRNPKRAVETLLYWLQADTYNPTKAAQCLQGPNLTQLARESRAQQIIEVLDAKGLFVKMEQIPTEPDYQDQQSRHRYTLFSALPDVYVVRVDERWLWSQTTVDKIPSIHEATFVVDLRSLTQRMPPWLQRSLFGVAGWQLVALLLLLFVAQIVRAIVATVTGNQLRKLASQFGAQWSEQVFRQINRPVGMLAAAVFAWMFLPVLRFPAKLTQVGQLAIQVVGAISAVWAAYRLVDLVSFWMAQRAAKTATRLDDQLVPLVQKALRIFVLTIGTVFVLQNLNVDVAGLIAGLGLGGLAFALAAKDTVANLFGSATIFADRPFHVGDWIAMGQHEGIVERVGFRSTRIRTFYNSLISMPNAMISDSVVDNFGAREFRRVKATLGVTYSTTPEQMEAFVEGIRNVILNHPITRKDFFEVHFNNFGAASLDVLVYFFLKTGDWGEELRERHAIFLQIMRLARSLEVEFAFPTQTLHVASTPEHAGSSPSGLTLAELQSRASAFGPNPPAHG